MAVTRRQGPGADALEKDLEKSATEAGAKGDGAKGDGPVEEEGLTLKKELRAYFLGAPTNALWLFIPLVIALGETGNAMGLVFVFAIFALVPLCERLGYVTEQLAMHTNETVGGLLNATGGNAGELIVSVFALRHGYLRVVQTSLLGSVLSNLLLVLGTALLVGGIKHPVQYFKQAGVSVNSALLVLAGTGLMLPSSLDFTDTAVSGGSEVVLSRAISIVLLALYFAFLGFQLVTHKHLFDSDDSDTSSTTSRDLKRSDSANAARAAAKSTKRATEESMKVALAQAGLKPMRTTMVGSQATVPAQAMTPIASAIALADMGDEEDELELRLPAALGLLALTVFMVGVMSDYLVDTIDEAATQLNVPITFISAILLPVVGNAAEHAGAVMFAWKNRMDVAMGIAVGSATQIAVLAVPATVLIAWGMGEELSLDYKTFEVTVLALAIFLVIVVLQDGTGNWLKGVVLLSLYVFIGVGFWVHKDVDLDSELNAVAKAYPPTP